jgi:alpha/beta superfamily hydrolase
MTFMIPAGSVQLEAQLREPKQNLRGAVVVCHPHPVYGGTMDNRVVYRAAKAAAEAGYAALRFNFRGVGRSTGQFNQGIGEKEDAAAAIRWLESKYPALDLAMIGYSFGAWVGLGAGHSAPRTKALVGLGLPLDMYNFDFLLSSSKPALYIVGTRDEFCSGENLDHFESRLPSTSSVRRIEGSEHFFSGYIEVVQNLITDFFATL